MVLKIGKLRRAVSKMRQPFRFLAHLSLCGYISGVLCVLTGALLLAFFGSNLREDEAIKRIPTWIGIIATGSGIMFLFVGITLTILLCKLFDQHAAWEGHLARRAPPERFPSQPGLYPVQPLRYALAADHQEQLNIPETQKLT